MTKEVTLINPIEKHFSVLSCYHYYVFFLIFLSKWPMFFHVLNLIFLSPPMDYYCNVTRINTSVKDIDTKNVCPCEDPWWDRSVFTETMQTKFGILCENSWLVSFSQSVPYLGALIGCLIFGFLSDRFGRLKVFSSSCLALAISGCLVSVMPTAGAFIGMRFIEGVSVAGAIVTSYVLCIEYCGVKHRETVTALFHIPMNLGHLTLPGISYLLRDFDHFQLALSIPMFFFAGCILIMMESPKWLMDSNHIDRLVMVIQRIDRNRTTAVNIKAEIEDYLLTQVKNTNTKLKFWEIFKHKKLTTNFCCMCVIFFVCGGGYYGVAQFIGAMSGNIHINVALSGAILLPGTLLCVYLLRILNRRTFLMATNFLSGIFIIIVVCIPSKFKWVRVVFACFCNCFFGMSFIIVFLFGVELFPTSVRNSVIGILSVLTRVGQIVDPFIIVLSETAAGIIFGVMAILGGILSWLLPETKDIELPSSLEDTKMLTHHRKSSNKEIGGSQPAYIVQLHEYLKP